MKVDETGRTCAHLKQPVLWKVLPSASIFSVTYTVLPHAAHLHTPIRMRMEKINNNKHSIMKEAQNAHICPYTYTQVVIMLVHKNALPFPTVV